MCVVSYLYRIAYNGTLNSDFPGSDVARHRREKIYTHRLERMKIQQRVLSIVMMAALTGNTIHGLSNLFHFIYSYYSNTSYRKYALAHSTMLIGLLVTLLLVVGFAMSDYFPAYVDVPP